MRVALGYAIASLPLAAVLTFVAVVMVKDLGWRPTALIWGSAFGVVGSLVLGFYLVEGATP